jgi:hypothetical protein
MTISRLNQAGLYEVLLESADEIAKRERDDEIQNQIIKKAKLQQSDDETNMVCDSPAPPPDMSSFNFQDFVVNELRLIKADVVGIKSFLESKEKKALQDQEALEKRMRELLPKTQVKKETKEKSVATTEQLEEYGEKRRSDYKYPDSSYHASVYADLYYGSHEFERMFSYRFEAVLYSPSKCLQFKDTDVRNANKALHSRPVYKSCQAYALRKAGGCVWEKRNIPPPEGEEGISHYVIAVTTAEGNRVLVDWSLDQFAVVPDDLLLFATESPYSPLKPAVL